MSQPWLLEFCCDGDVYTVPDLETTVAKVEELLRAFDGQGRWYVAVFDVADEACMWCYGEPERRVVEVQTWETPEAGHQFVLQGPPRDGWVEVRLMESEAGVSSLRVSAGEVLDVDESIAVVSTWFREKRIPPGYALAGKRYLFGS